MADSSHSSNKLLPPKFSGTDKPIPFLQWKDAVETYILSLNGEIYNELLLPRPEPAPAAGRGGRGARAAVPDEPEIDEDEIQLYQEEGYVSTVQNRAKVALIIKSCLDMTLSGEYIGPAYNNNPKNMWDALNNRYDRNTEGAKQDLQTELQHTHMKRGESIDSYTARLNSIWNRMTTRGEPPSNSMKIHHLLYRLSDDYKTIAATLITRANELSIEKMTNLLRDRCDEIERQKRIGDNREEQKEVAHIAHGGMNKRREESAAFVHRDNRRGRGRGNAYGKRYNNNNNNRREYKPYNRNEQHNRYDRRDNNNAQHNKRQIMCANCYQIGHPYTECKSPSVCKLCRKPGHRVSDCRHATHNQKGNNDRAVKVEKARQLPPPSDDQDSA